MCWFLAISCLKNKALIPARPKRRHGVVLDGQVRRQLCLLLGQTVLPHLSFALLMASEYTNHSGGSPGADEAWKKEGSVFGVRSSLRSGSVCRLFTL